MSGVTRNAVIAVLSDPGHRRARHHGQHMRDRSVGDVALFAVKNEMRAVFARLRLHLHIRRIRSGFLFRQRKCGQMLARSRAAAAIVVFARAFQRAATRECQSNDARS